MADLKTFNVSDILQKLADILGISVEIDGIDDTCYGFVIQSDQSFLDVLTQIRDAYNFQIIDGSPIRIKRRAIGDDLVIDYEIAQADCKISSGPSVLYSRLDINGLPRQVEVQYIDPERDFSISTQMARHTGAPVTNVVKTITLPFVISSSQARAIAFDVLFRSWSQQLSIPFEHDDISIEPGDVIKLTADQGIFTLLAQESTFTTAKTNQVATTVLLTSSGISVDAGSADSYVVPNTVIDDASAFITAI